MKFALFWAVAVVLAVGPIVHAEEVAADSKAAAKLAKREKAKLAKKKKLKPEPGEIVLSGNIAREEKAKANGGKASVKYVLTDTEGNKIILPKPRMGPKKKKDGKGAALDLDDYLHVGVKVYGVGTVERKGDKETVKLSKILRIDKGPGIADIDIFSRD